MGKNGYRHYQTRLVSDRHDFFDWCKVMLPSAHVEEASTEIDQYERKSGLFLSSTDTPEIRSVRFGTLRKHQEKILTELDTQNDRQIHFFYDPTGSHGKSWFTIYQYEHRDGFVVPRSDATAGKLSAFICSGYNWEKYIIVDLPRASIANGELFDSLEYTKDGLVFDHRYKARTRNIRGAKLAVFTNNPFDPDLLSWDREVIFEWADEDWRRISVNHMRELYKARQKKRKASKKKQNEGGDSTSPPSTPP